MRPRAVNFAWPESVIAEAVSDFNAAMHDGADIDSLEAGMDGLVFLTRYSTISDDLRARVHGAIMEGEMRVALYAEDDARTAAYEQATRAVRMLSRQCLALQERIRRQASDVEIDFTQEEAWGT